MDSILMPQPDLPRALRQWSYCTMARCTAHVWAQRQNFCSWQIFRKGIFLSLCSYIWTSNGFNIDATTRFSIYPAAMELLHNGQMHSSCVGATAELLQLANLPQRNFFKSV